MSNDDTFTYAVTEAEATESKRFEVPDRPQIQIYRNPDGTTRLVFLFHIDLTDDERDILAEETALLFDDRQFESLSSKPYRVTGWKTTIMGAIARLMEATPVDLVRILIALKNPSVIKEVPPHG